MIILVNWVTNFRPPKFQKILNFDLVSKSWVTPCISTMCNIQSSLNLGWETSTLGSMVLSHPLQVNRFINLSIFENKLLIFNTFVAEVAKNNLPS